MAKKKEVSEEKREVKIHLPKSFEDKPKAEREKILEMLKANPKLRIPK